MNRPVEEIEFTLFDTETTGLDPRTGDRIVEIAGIRYKGETRIATFQSLVNPEREISPAAFQVNHITSEEVAGAPRMAEVMPQFLKFIKGSCVCSYNAPFDMAFLNAELLLLGERPLEDVMIVDVLKMARRLLPRLERYALWFIAEKLGIHTRQQHRAFSDVEITLEVFQKLKQVLYQKGITDFKHFFNLFGIHSPLMDDLIAQKTTKIQEAMSLGVKLKIKYFSTSSASVSERIVAPKEIKQDSLKRSYLVADCDLRKEERTFRIDGILHVEVL